MAAAPGVSLPFDPPVLFRCHHDPKQDVNCSPKQAATQDQSSRTSLAFSDSWDGTPNQDASGVDVPALLQPFFGFDFIPFTTTSLPSRILEEDGKHDSLAQVRVPKSVEILKQNQRINSNNALPKSGVPTPFELPESRIPEEEGGKRDSIPEVGVPKAVEIPGSKQRINSNSALSKRDVPKSFEFPESLQRITSSSEQATNNDSESVTSVLSCRRTASASGRPEDARELGDLIRDHQQKLKGRHKKRAGKRIKSVAKAVLNRVSSGKSGKKKSSNNSICSLKHQEFHINCDDVSSTMSTSHSHVQKWVSPALTEETLSPLSGTTVDTCTNSKGTGEIHEKVEDLKRQTQRQETQIQETYHEIRQLQSRLESSIAKYQAQLSTLQVTQKQLEQLTLQVSPISSNTIPVEQPVSTDVTDPPPKLFKRSESGSFMRVHDLDLKNSLSENIERDQSVSSLSHSNHSSPPLPGKIPEFLLMDHYLIEIVQSLTDLGFRLACDEGKRFTPTKDTSKLLAKRPPSAKSIQNGWPVKPWVSAWDQEVLVWTGKVSHDGFGNNWPVVRGRAILHTSAKNVLEYMWNSKLVKHYNPMCEGRSDIYKLQEDVHMSAQESSYGIAGCAKIVQSINKHRLLPKAIEMKSLLYARPLEEHKGSYVLVSRSVWENETATLDPNAAKAVIRTEMLLGCTIMRALDDGTCEMTQLSHVHMPGVPEMLARRTAPSQCVNLMNALQSLFPPPE